MPPLPDLVIGALLALLGVLVAQLVAMLQARFERQHKREILLRTKYEELGLHFLDSMKLPGELIQCENDEQTRAWIHQSSANHAQLLALVYFPLLQQATEQYTESYSALCLAAISLYNPEVKTMLGTQVFDKPEYIVASNNHREARDNLAAKIKIHAALYAKS